MSLIDIIKPLFNVLSNAGNAGNAGNESWQHEEKNYWECRESNPGCYWVKSNSVASSPPAIDQSLLYLRIVHLGHDEPPVPSSVAVWVPGRPGGTGARPQRQRPPQPQAEQAGAPRTRGLP